MKIYVKLVAALVALVTAAGCAAPAVYPAPDSVPQLTIYTSHKKEVYGPVIKEFQERTGIWVRVEEAGTNELLARISGEPAACDIMFGGGVESLEAYSDCFLPYQTSEAEQIDPAFCSKENIWTPFSALPLVFIYNTKLLTAETAPSGWNDLLLPQWAGNVAYADPNISGSCYTALATAIQALPEVEQSETIESFFGIVGNGLLEGSTAVYTSVSDGSFMVGITLEESAIKQMNMGKDIALLYPADGTSAVPDGTAIVKGTQNPEGAKMFVDFTVSRDVQILLSANMSRRSVRSDIEPAQGLPAIDQLPLINYDVAWASGRKRAILEQWNSLHGGRKSKGDLP